MTTLNTRHENENQNWSTFGEETGQSLFKLSFIVTERFLLLESARNGLARLG